MMGVILLTDIKTAEHHNLFLAIGFIFFAITVSVFVRTFFGNQGRKTMDTPNTGGIQLISPAFAEGQSIPSQYTCDGQNINPPLNIMDVPAEAKSLVLIMHDPDAISGDFTHWVMWDIPTGTKNIAPNTVPVGAMQGANSSGSNQYMGPCPPSGTGTHHYKFEIYALDNSLSLESGSTRDKVEAAMNSHVLSNFTLTGLVAAK
jgi:Raf kinase inhibitor-like YbhB/YbcL family protein